MHDDFVGNVVSNIGMETPFGRAFITEKPVVIKDFNDTVDFSLRSFYAEHGVVSVMAASSAPGGLHRCVGSRQHHTPRLRCYRRQLFDRNRQCASRVISRKPCAFAE